MGFASKQLDLIFAGAVIAVSLIVSAVAYDRLMEIERPSQAVLNKIPVGETFYQLFAGEQCVGRFWSRVVLEPGTAFSSAGEIGIGFRGQEQLLSGFIGAYFNPLNQMVSCDIKITYGESKLTVRVRNPNPINIAFNLEFPGRVLSKNFTVAGPVTAVLDGKKFLRVDYSTPEKLLKTTVQPILPSLSVPALVGAPLDWYDAAKAPFQCSNELGKNNRPIQYIEMDPIIGRLAEQAAHFRELASTITGIPKP